MSCYVLDPDASAEVEKFQQLDRTFTYSLKTGKRIQVELLLTRSKTSPQLQALYKVFNEEIRAGSYPQNHSLPFDEFVGYYCSHLVFYAHPVESREETLGSFYIKPNFPGRSSHICNAGFLVLHSARGLGVGSALAEAFKEIAPAVGYKAAFFNLVYEDNLASIAIWKKRKYMHAGRVPAAKYSATNEPVDALMMYKAFDGNHET